MAGCSSGLNTAVRCGVAAVAVVAAVLTGCASEPDFEWPEDLVDQPQATLAPFQAAAVDEILAAFEGFRQVEVAVQADPEPAHMAQHRFNEFLGDPLLTLTLFDIEMMYNRGLVRQGEPQWAATVVEMELDGTPPTATVRECLDATGWRLAERATGGAADPAGLPSRFSLDRYVMEYRAISIGGRWLFDEARVERGEQC